MSVIHAPKKPELDFGTLSIPIVISFVLFVLFLRLWYFQIVLGPELKARAARFNTNTVENLAPRGLIYDRNGVLIAGVHSELVLTAIPLVVRQHPDGLERVAELLGVPVKQLQAKVDDGNWRPYLPTPIYLGASIQVASKVAEAGDDLPGIGVESQPMRYYPDSVSMSQVLGYVWVPSQGDVKRLDGLGVTPATYVGKTGIEWVYEKYLMGKPGSDVMQVDAHGKPVQLVERDNATPGAQLKLSIDAHLQQYAMAALKGFEGSAVAIDPKTGEVLCMASSPTYDANLFLNGISQQDFNALSNDPADPLYNRASHAGAPPGSSFKLVTSVAMYESGHFDPDHTEDCRGYYQIGKAKLRCLGVHGIISYHRALVVSCNTYFAALGVECGPDALRKACLECGLGKPTGIDLRSEDGGVVPTREWLDSLKTPHPWHTGDTANMSVGQGYLRVSPLQMADVVCMAANDGTCYRPHFLVSRTPSGATAPIETEPEVLYHVDADASFWDDLRSAMIDVVGPGGTAPAAAIPGVVVAGKTGSAQHYKGKKTDSWFIGYAPANDPKIAICVMLSEAGHGGEFAAPVAGTIMKHYLGSLDKAPAKSALAPLTQSTPAASPNSR